jgi:UDPglucose 6-dehydrogenase
MDRPKIGIIGFGFLGRAMVHGFILHADIKIYDKYDNTYDSLEETVNDSDFIFVGVPTPMLDDGSQDLSNMDDAVDGIVRTAKSRKSIVLRSTAIPGTTRAYAAKYPDHDFVFCPEFLTERAAKLDFINASRFILGGDKKITARLEEMYRVRFTHTPIYHTTWEGAELAKYMANCFFAVKVSFLNEMYDISENIGVSYEELKNMWLADYRIGNSHTDVPGHDGLRGYGGKCFPKDVKAVIRWAEDNNLHLDICKAADEVNDRVRPVKDWEYIRGATSAFDYEETADEKI